MLKKPLKTTLLFWLLSFCICEKALSQTVYNWQDFVENYLMQDVENPLDEGVTETLYDIHRQPFDVNTVTKEQLESLPFLSDLLIEEILTYQYQNKPLQSLDELQLVRTMDFETFQYLRLFLTIKDTSPPNYFPTWNKFLKYGKRALLLQGDFPLYWKEGNKRHSPEVLEKSPNKEYLGQRFSTTFRFDWSYRDKIAIGFTADKDAGEPFFTFTNKNKGFDFYSYYFLLNDFNKWLKTVAVGQYRLGFGQGLVMNTDFSMGKTAILTSSGIRNATIRKHSSRSEYNYFRGMATTIRMGKHWEGTAFYSHVNKDANINKEELITSWKTDGYHRTPLEISKKGNTVNQTFGGNLNYHYNKIHIGLTGVYNYFNRLFKTHEEGYRRYYPGDYRQWNISTDYRLHYKRHSLQGELAMSHDKAVATINTLRLGLTDYCQAIFLHRFYSYKYNAMYGHSFSESSLVKNESGVMGGIRFTPSYKFNLTAFADLFYFPWETYKAAARSKGYEFHTQGFYAFTNKVSIQFRYRFKSRQQDYQPSKDVQPALKYYSRHSPRLQADIIWKDVTFKTSLNGSFVCFKEQRSKGFLISQSIRLPSLLKHFDLQFNGHYFHTDNYDTRLSAYESGLLYQFGFSSFYGHGYRCSMLFRYRLITPLSIMAKFGHTQYFDRDHIGTGTERSEGNKRENISLQIHYKF